jgi:hypothetical protein
VIRNETELPRLTEEEPNHVARAQLSAHAACHHVGSRRSLRAQKGLETIGIELVAVFVHEDEVLVRRSGGFVNVFLRRWGRRENLLPGGEEVFLGEAGPGRSQLRDAEQAQEARANRAGGGLDERSGPILRHHELRSAPSVARQERNAVLEALVDDIGRVVDKRGHDRQRARVPQQSDRLRLIEIRSELERCDSFSHRRRQGRAHAFGRPGCRVSADE